MTGSLGAVETALWGILTFSILVVLHELGHFLAARAFKVKVHEFMVGLPGPAIRLHTKSMDWGVTAVPLGGYVRIAGMEPGAEDPLLGRALLAVRDAGPLAVADLSRELGITEERAGDIMTSLTEWKAVEPDVDERFGLAVDGDVAALDEGGLVDAARRTTYRGQSTARRVAILSMGIITNLLVAILTFTLVLSIWGYYDATTTIAAVGEDSAAEQAGIKAGDVLISLDGKQIATWNDFQMMMETTDSGQAVTVTISRDGEQADIRVVLGEKEGHGFMGVGPETVAVHPTVAQALGESLSYVGIVLKTILRLFDPNTFPGTVKSLTGVVGVSVMAREAAAAGALAYAGLVAMLSLSLGMMNLLPIPPLDGGKIALEIVERVLGRPLPRNVTLGFSAVGAVLLFSLIGYVMYLDIVRYAV